MFTARVPVGLPDVGHYPELFVALLESGTWTLEDLSKLAGLNFLRVLKEVEKVKKCSQHFVLLKTYLKQCCRFYLFLSG